MTRSKLDKEAIKELAELLVETGLSEIEWSDGGIKIRVARTLQATVAVSSAMPAVAAMPAAAAAPAAADPAQHPGAVKSPMVGTAYHSPEPGAPAFIKVGDHVREGQTVMIVEAMKTMNAIPAPRSGRVTEILVKNQEPVEFGQALLVIE